MDSFSVSSSVLLDSELDLVFAVFYNHSLSALPSQPQYCAYSRRSANICWGWWAVGAGEKERKKEGRKTTISNTVGR